MAAPNVVNVATITAKSQGQAVSTTATTIIAAVGAGKVIKVNVLLITNVAVSAATITAQFYDSSAATTYRIAYAVSIPANSTLVLISKDTSLYLEEKRHAFSICVCVIISRSGC